jgi:hypothetical protein
VIFDFGFSIFDSPMTEQELKERTKAVCPAGLKLTDSLPEAPADSGESGGAFRHFGGANYRSACRALAADLISKMSPVEEEADESCFWMELIGEAWL